APAGAGGAGEGRYLCRGTPAPDLRRPDRPGPRARLARVSWRFLHRTQKTRMGSPGSGEPTHALSRRLEDSSQRCSELHLVELLEQSLGIELVAGLARIVGAQGHAAHASQLLGVDL